MRSDQSQRRGRHLSRYGTQMSIAPAVLLAMVALAAHASLADAAPSCAEGPQTVGETIVGTPCADTIHAPRGVTTVYGEAGNDTIFGGRGNESLYGGGGNDRLYGGPGDDRLRGGAADDLLSGGFGADSLDGEAGSDYARGDATIDYIGDTGTGGTDTISFATGVPPPASPIAGNFGFAGFPQTAQTAVASSSNSPRTSPTTASRRPAAASTTPPEDEPLTEKETFDKLRDGHRNAVLRLHRRNRERRDDLRRRRCRRAARRRGRRSRSSVAPTATTATRTRALDSCESSDTAKEVVPPNPSKVSVGLMIGASVSPPALYLDGSDNTDLASDDVQRTAERTAPVTFELLSAQLVFRYERFSCRRLRSARTDRSRLPGNRTARLDRPRRPGGRRHPRRQRLSRRRPRSSNLAARKTTSSTARAAKTCSSTGPATTSPAPPPATTQLPNNQGEDSLSAGAGDDLFISDAVCEGDALDGGEAATTPTGRSSGRPSRSTSRRGPPAWLVRTACPNAKATRPPRCRGSRIWRARTSATR